MSIATKSVGSANALIGKFSALGDRTRFRLLKLLIDNDGICVSELAREVEISNAGVSQQLKVLEQAGIVIRKRRGQKICYEVNHKEPSNQELLELINKE